MMHVTHAVQFLCRMVGQGSVGRSSRANGGSMKYADDLLLFANKYETLQDMMDRLMETGKNMGLKLT